MPIIVDGSKLTPKVGNTPGVGGMKLMGADSGSSRVMMAVMTIAPGATLPLHVHTDPESFFILGGQGVLIADGVETPIGPECAILAQPGEKHAFTNRGTETLRVLCIHPVGQPQTTWIQ